MRSITTPIDIQYMDVLSMTEQLRDMLTVYITL